MHSTPPVLLRLRLACLALLGAALPTTPARADARGDARLGAAPRFHFDAGIEGVALPPSGGSAGALRGRICLQHVFVEAAGASWTGATRRDALRAAGAALAFLRRRAAEHGVSLSWMHDVRSVTIAGPVPVDLTRHRWTEAAVEAAGSPCSGRAAAGHLRMLHVAVIGRSYALPEPLYRDERVVMMRRTLGRTVIMRRTLAPVAWRDARRPARLSLIERPAAFAHEILHVFGAEDLYQPEARRRTAESLYPDDVMLTTHRPLGELIVGPLSARSIGWDEGASGRARPPR